ncbi:3-isopropylmalate dehydratase [Pseudomonas sp. TCU-HL1]|uniref:3-isopropylmalate dehydratase n=1 Tax=Pseudomonas sp. TCU-HL1 TaxID=1856685 RepID=UPI00083D4B2D|nr:3-isopropylmalate dehydratase [Pseudomonas sp. TCU-HL1]AOE83336.1 3-isopropylmalate dehydratase [Pseudomonas sp. TCU-HL1]
MRLTCAAVSLLLLAGCSSYRTDPMQITQVPTDRLLAFQTPVEGGGLIVVNRDMGGLGSGCYIAVHVDRQLAARIGIGEVASFQVPSGDRIVGIGIDETDDTLCSKGSLRREKAAHIEQGQSEHFRIISDNREGFALLADQPDAQ